MIFCLWQKLLMALATKGFLAWQAFWRSAGESAAVKRVREAIIAKRRSLKFGMIVVVGLERV